MRNRQLQAPLFTLFALILPLALLSCDSSGTNNNGENDPGRDTFSLNKGNFSATITEDGTETDVSGSAVFGVATDVDPGNDDVASDNGEAFIIYLLEGEKTLEDDGDVSLAEGGTEIILSREDSTVPGTGTTSLDQWSMVNRTPNIVAGSPDGTVDITTSSDGTLEGTFQVDVTIGGISVEGSFTAEERDDIDSVLCAPGCDTS